jgi:uncharacterized protein
MHALTVSDEVVPLIYSGQIRERFQHVDLVFGCGDLPIYYLEYIVTMLARPVYFVHGNHDHPEIQAHGQVIHQARGAQCIDGSALRHGQLLIAGLGGSIRYKTQGHHQYTQTEMMLRAWRLIPRLLWNRLRYGRYLDILLTHAPPLGIHNGPDYPHRGFSALNFVMQRFEPRWLIHGHVHANYGYQTQTVTQAGRTTVVNTSGYRVLDLLGRR